MYIDFFTVFFAVIGFAFTVVASLYVLAAIAVNTRTLAKTPIKTLPNGGSNVVDIISRRKR